MATYHPLHTTHVGPAHSKPGYAPLDAGVIKGGGAYNDTSPGSLRGNLPSTASIDKYVADSKKYLSKISKSKKVTATHFDSHAEQLGDLQNVIMDSTSADDIVQPHSPEYAQKLQDAEEAITQHASSLRKHHTKTKMVGDVQSDGEIPLPDHLEGGPKKFSDNYPLSNEKHAGEHRSKSTGKVNNWAKWDAAHPKR